MEAVGELVNSTVTLVGDPVGNSPSIIALKLLLEVVADDVLVVSVVSTVASVVVETSIGPGRSEMGKAGFEPARA